MSQKSKIKFEESSGNIFEDLELADAKELKARALIGVHLVRLLKSKEMKQRELGELLEMKQAEVSHLLNGHFSRFTTDKLLSLLAKMNQKVTIEIRPRKNGEPYQEVAFS